MTTMSDHGAGQPSGVSGGASLISATFTVKQDDLLHADQ